LRPDMVFKFQLEAITPDNTPNFLTTEIALAPVEAGDEHMDKDKVLGLMRSALGDAVKLAWRGTESDDSDPALLKHLKVCL